MKRQRTEEDEQEKKPGSSIGLTSAMKPRIRLGLSKSSISPNTVTKMSNPTSTKTKESSKVEKPTIQAKSKEVKPKVEQKKVSQLNPISKPTTLSKTAKPTDSKEQTQYYKCLHCKRSNKKHKTYDDGIIIVKGNSAQLKDMEGNVLGKTTFPPQTLASLANGSTLDIGQNTVEIDSVLSESEYLSGKLFVDEKITTTNVVLKSSASVNKEFKSHFASTPKVKAVASLYNPTAQNALVLFSPPDGPPAAGKQMVHVVVDPSLSASMRPHQKEGVKFMYDCIMGFKKELIGNGCILADSMGLGKTLQAIAIIWTLLKQGPYGKPTIDSSKKEKVFVVTQSSLVKNWVQELKKWLGFKIKFLAVTETGKGEAQKVISEFIQSSTDVRPLLIISYEQFLKHEKELQEVNCGLLVCDEGHRLKNSNIKTTKAIDGLETKRRIILSGTPIQNDLDEFYAMCNFVNPNVLGTYQSFKKNFANPIVQGREPNATSQQKKEMEARSQTLSEMTSTFILRRTSDILDEYLTLTKVEQVVFCPLTELQIELYKNVNLTPILSGQAEPLAAITKLKKICNHPALLYQSGGEMYDDPEEFKEIEGFDDFDPKKYQPEFSGKLQVLDKLLRFVKNNTKDKVSLLSHSTKVLDVFEAMCKTMKYEYLRLDGSTPSEQRQKLVNNFNEKNSKYFVFLLSTKAGGVGFNLIGSNRLILFDSDWNPSHDQQAMGRVWRDGQQKNVWIYRLLSTGTIEEKIFQRQLMKQGLSHTIIDGKSNESKKGGFTKEELKDIFTLNVETICDTHDLLGCTCTDEDENDEDDPNINSKSPKKMKTEKQTRRSSMTVEQTKAIHELKNWDHAFNSKNFTDPALATLDDGLISFVFSLTTNKSNKEEKSEEVSKSEEEEEGEKQDPEDLSDVED